MDRIQYKKKGCPAGSGISRYPIGERLARDDCSTANGVRYRLFQIVNGKVQMGRLLLRFGLGGPHGRLMCETAVKGDAGIGALLRASS